MPSISFSSASLVVMTYSSTSGLTTSWRVLNALVIWPCVSLLYFMTSSAVIAVSSSDTKRCPAWSEASSQTWRKATSAACSFSIRAEVTAARAWVTATFRVVFTLSMAVHRAVMAVRNEPMMVAMGTQLLV
uniref:Uncharacterized protein n=1 Tax=Streptomyces auratus AGR0001 TaxID=1160718 RepID=J2K2W0_9ACTN